VPTLAEWALALLTLLMTVGGVLSLRMRRSPLRLEESQAR